MTKKLSISYIKKEALDKYNFTLLSEEYINSHTSMEWLDNNTGVVFKRAWHYIIGGQITPGNPNKRLSIEDVRKEAFDKYNLILISTTYVNSRTKMEWLDNKTGYTFLRAWGSIKSGSTGIGVSLRIEGIKNEALTTYGFELLSNEYKGVANPMEWKEVKTGIIFIRSWSNIKQGQVLVRETNYRMTRKEVYDIALKSYGLTLLSREYYNSTEKLKWKDNRTGNIFYRSWSNINGKQYTNIRPSNVNDYNIEKKEIESFEGLGYSVITSEEKYNSGFRRGDGHLFEIIHPNLEGVWVATKSQFKLGALSRLNGSNISSGEMIVRSILLDNGIAFEYQKRVTIADELHIFDFYLPNHDLFIEYDGEQHYHPVAIFGGKEAYHKRVCRDKIKDKYVKSLAKIIVRIPYTLKDTRGITNFLNSTTSLNIKPVDAVIEVDEHDVIAEYYEHHTLKDTQNKFHVGRGTIIRIYKENKGASKRDRRRLSHERDNR